MFRTYRAIAILLLLALVGCGGGPKTHTIKGRVELAEGDVKALAGSNVEAVLESDTTVRASGLIKSDGSFTLETLHQGTILKGAQEGTYQVRFILSDDDKETHRKAKKALNPRYLSFETSGLQLQVPAKGTVTLSVASR